MKSDYEDIYIDIICSTTETQFLDKLNKFCFFVYDKLFRKLKEIQESKNNMDFYLVVSIEDINKEINEIVEKINNSIVVENQQKIAINLLYGLIQLNDNYLWIYFNQKHKILYN